MIKKIRLFGNQTPWNWALGLVHGCNLRCGHCCRALDKPNYYEYMTEETWVNAWNLIKEVSPTCRVDICLTGEPTVHPDIIRFLKIAKKISPLSQIQITTNGITLIKKKLTYKQLFDAGVNIMYVDMYAPKEQHEQLAKESGYEYYKYYENLDKKTKSPWVYHGDETLKMIILQEQPDNWPTTRRRAGLLGTWYNNLDWEKAKKYNMKPVVNAPNRRCNQPFIIVPVFHNGQYLTCCQDGMGETAGQHGSVNEGGLNGFKKYWFGEVIQEVRKNLREKDRNSNSCCSRCNITFSRCDYKHWTDEQVNQYYDGVKWIPTTPKEPIKIIHEQQKLF